MIRGEYFAGSFYPASKNEILSMFLEFNSKLDDSLQNPEILQKNPTAVIVPHAGYVYSGINANIAYRAIK
jgi:AmmeMemoRadiSam system protein B